MQYKKGALAMILVLLSTSLGIFLPANVAQAQTASTPYCLQVVAGGTLICASTMQECLAAEGNDIVYQSCFNAVQTANLTPSEQRSIQQSAEVAKRSAANANTSGNEDIFPNTIFFKPIGMLLAGLAFVIFKIAGFFLVSMAKIMDWSISVSIDSQLLGTMNFVNIGWTAVRDLSNMFFIFALLYIAIQTILGLAGGGAKRWLVHLIIAAILINFSLFMTKVVVDSGNILAVSIWNKIQTQQGSVTLPGASPKILGGLDLQTIFAANSNLSFLKPVALGGFSYGKMFLAYTGGAIFMFIAGYVLLAGALMMVTRTIMILLLMIFSPFAFMSFGLPKFEQYGHDWLDKLIKQTLVAPLFIFMLYLNSVLVDKLDIFSLSGSKGESFLGAVTGSGDYQIIFNFVMMIGFLVASLAIANKYAGDVGSHARRLATSATKWAGGAAVGATVGTSSLVMRQSLGKIGAMSKDNEELHKKAAEGGFGGAVARGKIAMYSGMARATYDPRATKIGQTALSGGGRIKIGQAGGKGGFETTGSVLGSTPIIDLLNKGTVGTTREKEVLEIAERRYANDPKGKEAYLRANLGTFAKTKIDEETGEKVVTDRFASRYDEAGAFKGQRQTVGREIATAEAKKTLRDNINAYKEAEKKGELDKVNTEGKKVGEAAAAEIKKSLGALNAKEAADMLDNEQLRMTPVIAGLNNQHLAGLNSRVDLTPETITAITSGVVNNGTDSAQKYLRTQARMGSGQFQVDAEKELERVTKDYNAKKVAFENTAARTPEIEQKWKEDESALKKESGKFLGMMDAEEVASLNEGLVDHEILTSQYNSKVQQKIREKLNNDVYTSAVAAKLSAQFGKQTPPKPSTPPTPPVSPQPEPSRIIIPPGSRTA